MSSLSSFFDKESSDSNEASKSWITRFCSQGSHFYFCEVDEEFIRDPFNLYGLCNDIHLYQQSLGHILGELQFSDLESDIDDYELEINASALYGMIHARYIVTAKGLEAMYNKYKLGTFGSCPRVKCKDQFLLPIGESDLPNKSGVKLFCPCCKEIYHPPEAFKYIDGAYFGTSFPHLFLLQYPELICQPPVSYEPSIFGFKIHSSSPYYGTFTIDCFVCWNTSYSAILWLQISLLWGNNR